MLDLLVISHACFTAINRNIYSLFQDDGWSVEIVIPKTLNFPSGIKPANPPMEGDPPINFLSLNGTNPRIYEFEDLIALLDQKKPKIVLLDNDPVSRMALSVGIWCTKNNAKIFCMSCENLSLKLFDTYQRRGIKSIPGAIAKRVLLNKTKKVVSGIFTINKDGQKLFIEEGYKNVVHIPLGFNPEYFYLDNEARQKIRTDLGLQHKVLAYFGRLVKEKGVHILIKALESLKDLPWHLMMDDFDIYTTGYAQEIHQLLKDTGIMERVVFIKPNHFEIAGFMNACDVMVVPSIATSVWKEQYGRVAAEGLACGKLLIASDSGALPELLGGHGLLFQESDLKALTILLRDLLTKNVSEITKETPESIAAYAVDALSIIRQKVIMEQEFKKIINN